MNRDDVVKGLGCCAQGMDYEDAACGDCPYKDAGDCVALLCGDAKEAIEDGDMIRAEYVERLDGLLAELKDRPQVVRCADCRHWGEPFDRNDAGYWVAHCERFDESHAFSARFYCAGGEKRDDE